MNIGWMKRAGQFAAQAVLAAGLICTPAMAQVRTVDPNTAIDADLAPVPQNAQPTPPGTDPSMATDGSVYDAGDQQSTAQPAADGEQAAADSTMAAQADNSRYQRDDLIGAAEGVFGKGAEGLAGLIEKILKDQGQPNAYRSEEHTSELQSH